MANNDDEFGIDELNLDNFGPDMDSPEPDKMKNDRNVVTTIADNFADGVKSTAFETQFIKNNLRKSLPDGYGKVMDVAGEAVSVGKDLYDSAAKELKPGLLALHKAAKTIAPNLDNLLPKALVDKINAVTMSDQERADVGKANYEENEIQSQIGSIFKTQIEAQAALEQQREVQDTVNNAESKAVDKSLIAIVDSVRQSAARLVGYQDSVTAKYQQKHLELTYRQFFATKNLLETTRNDNVRIIDLLQGVVKNTGLPEHVKVNMSEMASQSTKEKLVGFAQQKVGDYSRNFIRNVGNNIRTKAGNAIRDINSKMQDAIMIGDQLNMAQEMAKEAEAMGMGGGGMTGMAAQMAGGSVADYLGDLGAKQVLKLFQKSDKARKYNAMANYGADNLPEIMNEWAKTPSERDGAMGWLENLGKSLIPKGGAVTDITQDHLAVADKAVEFTNRTAKSINEIIPGYLARLLKSSEGIRTGKVPDAEVFDFKADGWTTQKTKDQRVLKGLLPKRGIDDLTEEVGRLIDEIDTDKVLSPDSRAALTEQFLRDSLGNKGFNPARYADSTKYNVDANGADIDSIANLFKDKYKVGTDGKFAFDESNVNSINKASSSYRRFARDVPDIASEVFKAYTQGNQDSLRRLGLLDESNGKQEVNYDTVLSMFRSEATRQSKNPDFRDTDRAEEQARQSHDFKEPPVNPYSLGDGPKPKPQPSGPTQNVTMDASYTKALNAQTKMLTDAIKENRIVPEVRQLVALVQAMIQNQTDQLSGDYQKRAKTRLGRLFQSSGNFIGDTWGILKSPLKGIGKMYGGIAGGMGNVFRGAGWGLGGLAGLGTSLAGGLLRMGDLYIRGKASPVLTKYKLKAGHYIDSATGKPIKSWRQLKKITGDIKDTVTGDIALRYEDFKDTYDARGQNLMALLGTGVRGALDATVGRAWRIGAAPLKGAWWLAKKIYKFANGAINVYLKNDLSTPKLYATAFEAGEYLSAATGKPVLDWDQIDGPLRRKSNPEDYALTEDDLKIGLCDENGKDLKTVWQKVSGLARTAFNLPFKVAGRLKGLYKKGFTWAGNLLGGMFSLLDNTLFSRINKQQVDILTEIRDMMRKQWGITDGDLNHDGYRDGSWQEKEAKRKAMEALKKVATPEAVEKFKNGAKWSKDLGGDAAKGIGNWIARKFGLGKLFGKEGDDDNEGRGSVKDRIKRAIGWGDGVERDSELAKSGSFRKKGIFKSGYDKLRDRWGKSAAKAKVDAKVEEIQQTEAYKSAVEKANKALYTGRAKVDELYTDAKSGELKRRGIDAAQRFRQRAESGELKEDAKVVYHTVVEKSKTQLENFLDQIDDIHKRVIHTEKEVGALDTATGAADATVSKRGRRKVSRKARAQPNTAPTEASTSPTLSTAEQADADLAAASRDYTANRKRRSLRNRSRRGIRRGVGALGSALLTGGSAIANEFGDDLKSNAMDAAGNFISEHNEDIRGAVTGITDNATAQEALGTVYDFAAGEGGEKALETAAGWVAKGATALGGTEALTAGAGVAARWGGNAALVAGGVLTAPVALAIGTAMAIGTVGYYGFKWFKGKLDTLAKVRFVQYGVNPEDGDQVRAVKSLEDELSDYIQYKGTTASLSEMKNGLADLLEIFDITASDKQRTDAWVSWFSQRFKPVFLSHLSVLRTLDATAELDDVDDDLDKSLKKSYLDKVKMDGLSPNPYDVLASPFGTDPLPENRAAIKAAFDAAYAELAEDTAEDDKKPQAILSDEQMKAYGNAYGVKTDAAGKPASQSTPTADITPLPKMYQRTDSNALPVIQIQRSNVEDFQAEYAKRVDALTSIKYKSYGLVELDALKIAALRRLEAKALSAIKYVSGGEAMFNGAGEDYYDSMRVAFGCGDSEDERNDWLAWFSNRFVPVFVNWCAAIHRIGAGIDPIEGIRGLEATEMLTVATAVVGATHDNHGSSIPIWDVFLSPWPGYQLNGNLGTTEPNMEFIRQLLKKKTLNDTVASRNDNSKNNNLKVADTSSNSFANTPSMMASWRNKTTSSATSNMANGFAELRGGVPAFGGDSYSGLGIPVVHPGKGSGGDVNTLPIPEGDGSWDALKDVIIGASKMAGVDPGIMATMASIESNFKAKARPNMGSAKGLYQFIDGTWNDMLRKYGSKYGISPNTAPTDARANALMGAEYIKENMDELSKRLGRPLTDADVYTAHFMGSTGAAALLKADPNADAVTTFPKEAANNGSIFAPGGKHRTVGEVVAHLAKLVSTHSAKYSKAARTYAGVSTTDTTVQSTGGKDTSNVPDLLLRRETTSGAGVTNPVTPSPSAVSPSTPSTGSTTIPVPSAGAVSPTVATPSSSVIPVPSAPAVSPSTTAPALTTSLTATSSNTTLPVVPTVAKTIVDKSTVNNNVIAPSLTAASLPVVANNDSAVTDYQQQLNVKANVIDQQSRRNAVLSGDSATDMVALLKDSLATQQSMDATLKGILTTLQNQPVQPAVQPSTPDVANRTASNQLAKSVKQTTSLNDLKLPVSLSRAS